LLFISFALTLECMQKDSSRVSHGLGVSMNKWHKLKCHSKETDFKWSSSCWETNVHWTFWFMNGPNWTKKRFASTLCWELYICRVSFLWASLTECLCPENQIDTYRKHTPIDSFQYSPPPPHCRLGANTSRARATIQFGVGNFYFMTILFCFSQVFWWPFVNRSRQLKHGHNLHCIALWNLKYMFALYLKIKIKFDYDYVMLENFLFEFYAGLGTNKVITWSNKRSGVCVSLSNESLITTCVEFGLVSWRE
jgi:hypothetical protein